MTRRRKPVVEPAPRPAPIDLSLRLSVRTLGQQLTALESLRADLEVAIVRAHEQDKVSLVELAHLAGLHVEDVRAILIDAAEKQAV